MRRGLTCTPSSLLLHVPQFFMRFSTWDLLALCTWSGVLTSMYNKYGILGSGVATSFLAATCSLSCLFFAFSLFVCSPCFFTCSCGASRYFVRSLSLLVGGGVTSGNFVSWPLASNSINYPSYSWTSCCCTEDLASKRTTTFGGVTWCWWRALMGG